jgi:hypothetical protein
MRSDKESGYALPSVLYLIVLLSIVALSVLLLQNFKRQLALREVARVKADYAAQSALTESMLLPLSPNTQQSFQYEDESSAQVSVQRWGFLEIYDTHGVYRKASSDRIALIASQPPELFSNALVFANMQHQVVLTGTASITGNVIIGPSGITTGVLKDMHTPSSVPVNGSITRISSPKLPQYDTIQVKNMLHDLELKASSFPNEGKDDRLFDVSNIGDSVAAVVLNSDALITGALSRRTVPLTIIGKRSLTLQNTRLRGVIALIAQDSITFDKSASIEHCLAYSRKSIHVNEMTSIRGQLIAPAVFIGSGATLLYPSIIACIDAPDSDSSRACNTLSNGSRIEGMVLTFKRFDHSARKPSLIVERSAAVVGAIVAEGNMTLEGNVTGTVCVQDFYFYESPTQYYGWLRSSIINRTQLPGGFLISPIFESDKRRSVLDWL